eukprot:ANDGO_04835.mRNA.1 Putative exosome complex exonuclease RRP42
MNRLSKSEIDYIVCGAEDNVRSDGRGCLDFRPITVETGISPQTSGSARVRIAQTDVVVGVKLDIDTVLDTKPNEGRIAVRVDVSPSLTGIYNAYGGRRNASEELSVEMSRILERFLSVPDAMDLKSLIIVPGKQCWIVHVDVLVLQVGGSLVDAVVMAAKAALSCTRIPAVSVTTRGSGECEIDISSDVSKYTNLDASNVPICVTLSKLGSVSIVDATVDEEVCVSAKVHVAVSPSGQVCALQKAGSGGMQPELFEKMVHDAKNIGVRLTGLLHKTLALDAAVPASQKAGFLLG